MHRLGAVADEGGEMVYVPGIACLGDQAESRAKALLEEMLVDGPHGERHRQRCAIAVRRYVAQDHDARPLTDGAAHGATQSVQGRPERLRTARGLPGGLERDRLRADHGAERRHLLREQHGVLVLHQAEPAGPVREQRRPATEVHPQGHHQGLAQRIDRRVRDLCEALAQVHVEARWHPGERRDRGVVPHAPHRVLAGAAHWLEHVAQVLEAPAEGDLPGDPLRLIERRCVG